MKSQIIEILLKNVREVDNFNDAIFEDDFGLVADEITVLFSARHCAEQTKNVLSNRFVNESRKHVGKRIKEVPELAELLKAIDVIEHYCI